jgi:hypothetical protein
VISRAVTDEPSRRSGRDAGDNRTGLCHFGDLDRAGGHLNRRRTCPDRYREGVPANLEIEGAAHPWAGSGLAHLDKAGTRHGCHHSCRHPEKHQAEHYGDGDASASYELSQSSIRHRVNPPEFSSAR